MLSRWMVTRPQRVRAESERDEDPQKSIFFYGELVCMFVDSYDLGQKNKRMN